MTTARQRYDQKTKVVTFRVSLEDYDHLEGIKAEGGLSYSDLIKLGANIASEEVKGKLEKVRGMEDKLAKLRMFVEGEERKLSESLDAERRRRREDLDTEIEAFKLFDRRWRIQIVSSKLDISEKRACHYFDQWVDERKDKEVAKKELLRRCLKEHITYLTSQGLSYNADKESLTKRIDYCQCLMSTPDQMSQDDQEFLIARYPYVPIKKEAKDLALR